MIDHNVLSIYMTKLRILFIQIFIQDDSEQLSLG